MRATLRFYSCLIVAFLCLATLLVTACANPSASEPVADTAPPPPTTASTQTTTPAPTAGATRTTPPTPNPARGWLDAPASFTAPDPVPPAAESPGAVWIGTVALLRDGRIERFEIPLPSDLEGSPGMYRYLTVSPDRQRWFGWLFPVDASLMMTYDRGSGEGQVWSTADTDLIINSGSNWSPDGTQTAFVSLYPEPYLVVIDAAGGDASVVPLLETLRIPAAPLGWIDNDTLLMAEYQANSPESVGDLFERFYHFSLSTESVIQRWERPGVSRPGLSPDGRFVSFWELSDTEIADHLIIREIATGAEVALDNVPPFTSRRVWAPDGSALALLTRPQLPGDRTAKLRIFSVSGERLAEVDEFIEADQHVDGFYWGADGLLIAAIGDRTEPLDSRLVEWAEIDGEWRKVRHDSGWTVGIGWIDSAVPLDQIDPLPPRIIATPTPYPYP